MHIEDLLFHLDAGVNLNRYDTQIVKSFIAQLTFGNGLTEKQSILAQKLLKRYSNKLSIYLQTDIISFIENPSYKFTIRKVNRQKIIKIVDHPILTRAIKVSFPYNNEKIDLIRSNKTQLGFCSWDHDTKSWIFGLEEKNIKFLADFIQNEDWDIDEEFQDYLIQLKTIIEKIEEFVPMVDIVDGKPQLKNHRVPGVNSLSDQLLSALFQARNYGIMNWSDTVEKHLDNLTLGPLTKSFLQNEKDTVYHIDSVKYPIECLNDMVLNLSPILFLIPIAQEFKKTEMVYHWLMNLGFTADQFSVMFRLSNKDNKNFNDFVKNCRLNNPISNATKFVFVSSKLVKPLLSSDIQFELVVNLGNSSAHYLMYEYAKNLLNFIHYNEKNAQTEFDFMHDKFK